jgi:hypothetical protein
MNYFKTFLIYPLVVVVDEKSVGTLIFNKALCKEVMEHQGKMKLQKVSL